MPKDINPKIKEQLDSVLDGDMAATSVGLPTGPGAAPPSRAPVKSASTKATARGKSATAQTTSATAPPVPAAVAPGMLGSKS